MTEFNDTATRVLSNRSLPSGGRKYTLQLTLAGEAVPAILLHPDSGSPTPPAALLIHGFTSRKERMSESIGKALLRNGVASLAFDLPMHGEREGRLDRESLHHPMQLVRQWRQGLAESRAALEWLHARFDATGIVGYSLGSFLAVAVCAHCNVGAMVLAAGGDLPDETPFAALVRTMADPLRAIAKFRKPLLMVNGRYDRTVTPQQATRLFERAREPKTMRWYNGGHWPPEDAIAFAAQWLSAALESGAAQAARRA